MSQPLATSDPDPNEPPYQPQPVYDVNAFRPLINAEPWEIWFLKQQTEETLLKARLEYQQTPTRQVTPWEKQFLLKASMFIVPNNLQQLQYSQSLYVPVAPVCPVCAKK